MIRWVKTARSRAAAQADDVADARGRPAATASRMTAEPMRDRRRHRRAGDDVDRMADRRQDAGRGRPPSRRDHDERATSTTSREDASGESGWTRSGDASAPGGSGRRTGPRPRRGRGPAVQPIRGLRVVGGLLGGEREGRGRGRALEGIAASPSGRLTRKHRTSLPAAARVRSPAWAPGCRAADRGAVEGGRRQDGRAVEGGAARAEVLTVRVSVCPACWSRSRSWRSGASRCRRWRSVIGCVFVSPGHHAGDVEGDGRLRSRCRPCPAANVPVDAGRVGEDRQREHPGAEAHHRQAEEDGEDAAAAAARRSRRRAAPGVTVVGLRYMAVRNPFGVAAVAAVSPGALRNGAEATLAVAGGLAIRCTCVDAIQSGA